MIEIQDILNQNSDYIDENRHHFSKSQLKALSSIQSCRTSVMGAHVDECLACGEVKVSYNSCRNRHCPKCQNIAKEEWIEARSHELINVPYFHVVFTVPHSLNSIIYSNQKLLYDIFFKAVSETLVELALDKKYLGAQLGVISVFHTWGQNLSYHPHIHCIVPGGGLSISGLKFIRSKKKFFIPVKVLSKKLRGKFLHFLDRDVQNSKVKLPAEINFRCLKEELYKTEWITYCKPPFKTPNHVINYLGRYTHKVAISNNSIISAKDGNVTFKWRDYKDNKNDKVMTLTAQEFIRRFLMHVLPHKFFKIRHYGLLSNRNKKTKLILVQKLAGGKCRTLAVSRRELMKKILGVDIYCCYHCGSEYVNRRFVSSKFLTG